VVSGEFSAKLETEESLATGIYGLGDSNEAGKRLREFCVPHGLIVADTMFDHSPRRRCPSVVKSQIKLTVLDFVGDMDLDEGIFVFAYLYHGKTEIQFEELKHTQERIVMTVVVSVSAAD